jgi:Ca2+-transporting ATPase
MVYPQRDSTGAATVEGAPTAADGARRATPWHTLDAERVVRELGTDVRRGLSSAEAVRRLAAHGPNELPAPPPRSPFAVFAAQFKNAMIAILLAALVPSFFLGHAVESITIAVIVAVSVVLGFLQEWRAERALEALGRMAAPTATVVRDGATHVLPARELVPGDAIVLREGDRVPADARLVEAANLRVAEAVLTGESDPVEKGCAPLAEAAAPVGDRLCLAHAGTTITTGRGRAIVIATGSDTEFGRIAKLLEAVEPVRTPLQRNLDRVGGTLAKFALGIVAAVLALGLVRGEGLVELFLTGVALAVAVVPEALPAVVTVSLALGVQRMAARQALVRRLAAVETLGSTTVICSDKTGTLTRNEMTVRRVWQDAVEVEVSGAGYEPRGEFRRDGRAIAPEGALRELLAAAALCSDARLEPAPEGGVRLVGDPTEGALVVAAAKAGLDVAALERELPRVDEIPFSSASKRMITFHRGAAGAVAFAKGAPEVVIAASARLRTEAGVEPLDPARRAAALDAARELAAKGLRVIAVAERRDSARADAGTGLTLLGLLAMIDPPRSEARAAVETCRSAGIRPVMITGDHPVTALAVAHDLGLCAAGRVVRGDELEAMSESELEQTVDGVDVYARVSPEHKLRLVRALQRRGHVVAMTGDGVNDAPALKSADIGVAMGRGGTDVSREAAAMTLLDDDFATIVAAVEEGRGIFANIRKYLSYLLSSNLGEIALVAVTSLFGMPLPLSAAQILYVNLATDGLPALALAVDPNEDDLMRRPPRDPRRGLLTRPVVALILAGGAWSAIVNVAVFAGALAAGHEVAEARTFTFVSLILIQFFKAYSFRSDRQSALRRPFANRWLDLAIVWEVGLLACVVSMPFLQRALGTRELSLAEWGTLAAAAATVVPVLEVVKAMARRGRFGPID